MRACVSELECLRGGFDVRRIHVDQNKIKREMDVNVLAQTVRPIHIIKYYEPEFVVLKILSEKNKK